MTVTAFACPVEQVKFTEKRMSFFHFLTNVCAIVGGKDLCHPFKLKLQFIVRCLDLLNSFNAEVDSLINSFRSSSSTPDKTFCRNNMLCERNSNRSVGCRSFFRVRHYRCFCISWPKTN